MKILVVDNYDSFVYNLVQMLGKLGAELIVRRNDQLTLQEAKDMKPNGIVISPGPGSPSDERYFGICTQLIQDMGVKTSILGVCLGHQGIVHTFGGKIIRASRLMHGKVSLIRHDGEGVFVGVKNPFQATRYHSLAADRATVPDELAVTASAEDDGEIMGVRHRRFPIEGVQFHPESVLTSEGRIILSNFLEGCGR